MELFHKKQVDALNEDEWNRVNTILNHKHFGVKTVVAVMHQITKGTQGGEYLIDYEVKKSDCFGPSEKMKKLNRFEMKHWNKYLLNSIMNVLNTLNATLH